VHRLADFSGPHAYDVRKANIAPFVTQVTAKGVPAFYIKFALQRMEAPMTNTITSRVAIQARIAEWQRQYRNSDHGAADFLFGGSNSLKWFRHA
jgi:hypothetical protein